MNQHDWQTQNEKYLKAAFDWLRARCADFLCDQSAKHQASSIANRLAKRLKKTDLALKNEEKFTPPPALTILLDNLQQPASEYADEEEKQRLEALRQFETALLLLCVGVELDPWVARGCQEIHGGEGYGYPTFSLAQQLFTKEHDAELVQQAMAANRPLRSLQLIEIHQPDGVSLSESRLSASEWLLNLAQGRYVLDELLSRLLVPLDLPGQPQPEAVLSNSQRERVDETLTLLWREAAASRALPIVQLIGPDSFSKRQVARYLGEQFRSQMKLELGIYRLPSDSLPSDPVDRTTFLRLWERECHWSSLALYLDLHEFDFNQPDAQRQLAIRQFLERVAGIIILDTRTMPPTLGRRAITIEVAKPRADEQFDAWRKHIDDDSAAQLASQFDLDLGTLQRIAGTVQKNVPDAFRFIWKQCLRHTRPRLDSLAHRIELKAKFDDLKLPAIQKGLIKQIADQVQHRYRVYDQWKFRQRMNRGLGISVLFAGDSGTGKTMAAEVIAVQLHLPLYRIDLSAVVSKYIGETEKNLRRMFDAFEDGGAVLLFDEADSLFGKRSEVKDSHDRYANIQIDYLLQRMEAFSGLAILATNMKGALDQAFLRRLRFVVDFPLPGLKERRAIWEQVFPEEVFGDPPQIDLNYVKLAKFNLTGGNIQTIALNAAGLAAAKDRSLTMQDVLESTKNEFRKLAQPINESDFRWLPKTESELVSV